MCIFSFVWFVYVAIMFSSGPTQYIFHTLSGTICSIAVDTAINVKHRSFGNLNELIIFCLNSLT